MEDRRQSGEFRAVFGPGLACMHAGWACPLSRTNEFSPRNLRTYQNVCRSRNIANQCRGSDSFLVISVPTKGETVLKTPRLIWILGCLLVALLGLVAYVATLDIAAETLRGILDNHYGQ